MSAADSQSFAMIFIRILRPIGHYDALRGLVLAPWPSIDPMFEWRMDVGVGKCFAERPVKR